MVEGCEICTLDLSEASNIAIAIALPEGGLTTDSGIAILIDPMRLVCHEPSSQGRHCKGRSLNKPSDSQCM